MDTSALADTALAELVHPAISVLNESVNYNDFRDELRDNGFTIVKGVIPKDRAVEYQQAAFDWLRSFKTGLKIENPETWTANNLPLMSPVNGFAAHSVAHEKFMWDARQEPGVLDAFSKIWGTDELLVSFDVLNITFPNRKDLPARKPWEHVDQSPSRRGLHCVQGIINLAPCGPEDGGLVVIPGSHRYHDEFYDTHPNIKVPATWKDLYIFSDEELRWFKEKGLSPYKVCAEPGDLILWDSRTIHYGSDPTPKGNQIRTVIYATYLPASLASEEQLKEKGQIFRQYGSTTHWPFDHLVQSHARAFYEDGNPDPRDRTKPLVKPDMTDSLLKLAGINSY